MYLCYSNLNGWTKTVIKYTASLLKVKKSLPRQACPQHPYMRSPVLEKSYLYGSFFSTVPENSYSVRTILVSCIQPRLYCYLCVSIQCKITGGKSCISGDKTIILPSLLNLFLKSSVCGLPSYSFFLTLKICSFGVLLHFEGFERSIFIYHFYTACFELIPFNTMK